ncbi:MAG: hypothetical protein PHD19_11575 [Dechloromonas sp.]|nr:hypothetical protein [Dechloromonas sp.]
MSTLQQIHADPARRIGQLPATALFLVDDAGSSKTATPAQITAYVAAAIADSAALQPVARFNPNTVRDNLTIPAGYNAAMVGPITLAEGVVVDIADSASLAIL